MSAAASAAPGEAQIEGPRVLVVTRRFWPSCSDSTQRLMSWAKSLQSRGASLTVLTPRWHSTWSTRIDFCEMPVHRLEYAPTNPMRSARYSRGLSDWVSKHCSNFDVIYCDAADLEAQIILTQVPGLHRPPVVIRFDPLELGDGSDPRWQPGTRTLDACRRASIVVAPRADAHQRLRAAGIQDTKIERIPDISTPIIRTDMVRAAARNALADINHDLFVRSTDRVVVCPLELTRKSGVEFLIRAIGPLVQDHRALRVWLLGDSAERGRFYDQLRYNGWHNLIAMPGAFEDLDEVLRVADMCIIPARGHGLGWLIPKCAASSVPFLTPDSPELRSMVDSEPTSQLTFRDGDVESLREKISQWLHSPIPFRQAIARAREQQAGQPLPAWDSLLARCAASFSRI
ncbi:MAG: glycosyltransferase family 4 protein [Pirellulaceae bacterium]|nr:glycosyltransferase family 4 protein [Pirellulaceae bacterium]